MHPWIITYKPKTAKDMIGQDDAIAQARAFLQSKKHKSAILFGPPGTGKTSLPYILAAENELEIIEVNASDFRNKEQINLILGNASKQRSLFAKGKIILIDEVEGLSGTKDRGALSAVAEILETTSFPVFITTYDPYDQKLSNIRKKSLVIEFHALPYTAIYERLKAIAEKEEVQYDDTSLKTLARRAGGDMRAAINDFQALSAGKRLSKEEMEIVIQREQKESIDEALMKIFKSSSPQIAMQALENIDESPDDVIMWLDQSLPEEYTGQSLLRAYQCLSKADVYRGRIRRWQHWRFMVYISNLISAGVAVSKDERQKKQMKYQRSERPLKIYIANMRYQKRKAISEKIAAKTHASAKDTLKNVVPYMLHIIKHNKIMAAKIQEEFDLSKDEIAWVMK